MEPAKKLPIGYWIKLADELLTKRIDEIQSSFGMTRTSWQILNAIQEHGSIQETDLSRLLQPFADTTAVEVFLTQLLSMELIEQTGQQFTLTNKGKEQFLTCLEVQKNFRHTAMSGLTEEDYRITLQTLQNIVNNIQGSF
ncbi:MAG TPA: MarR family winged helix-turn-helix transcriptional regulator [Agriterribacter sp.]|nr:MarR family winged helix-turn-helix transcriptional regulator [Agriterribacter sp.]